VDVDGMIRNAFMCSDDIHHDILNEERLVTEDTMNVDGDDDDENVEINVENLMRDSTKKI